MGVERTIYLGPYIEVRSPKKAETINLCKSPDECPQQLSGEGWKKGAEFCHKCGIPLDDIGSMRNVNRRPDFIEMFKGQGLMRCLSNTGVSPLEEEYEPSDSEFFLDCLVPNLANDVFDRGSFWLRDDAQDMTEISHGNETQWMRKAYKKELKILIETFGAENIRTRWGFLSYWD